MMTEFYDQIYFNVDFTSSGFEKGRYENCTFNNCNFLNLDLSYSQFVECKFNVCDLSLSNLAEAALLDTAFHDCKIMGVNFDACNQFIFTPIFEKCQLNNSVFYQMVLKKAQFVGCKLHEVDFSESDCSGVVFDNCDFHQAIFDHTILKKCDFRSSINYTIDLRNNQVDSAKFSRTELEGLLKSFNLIIE